MEDTKKTAGTKAPEPPESAEAIEMTKLGENIGNSDPKPEHSRTGAIEQAGMAPAGPRKQ
jgi:hypothetical protein